MTAFWFSSCVGTIKDANKSTTKASSSTDVAQVEYAGISGAVAVANDKVEISFPQSSLDADTITYVIRYDGLQVPIYLYGSSIHPDFKGLLRYTINNLQIDTNYSFSVQVRNVLTSVESNNTVLKQVKTFSNATANFMGVSELRNLTGADGTSGIEVFWIPAQVKGSAINKDEIDPIEYQVTVLDGSILNPASMNDPSFISPDRRVLSIGSDKRSTIINGLQSGKKYYVQVRAIHYGYSLNSADVSYMLEKNTKYMAISTYTEDISNINFDDTTFLLDLPPGSGGLYSLKASWSPPTGNFDHYRLYYAKHGEADIKNYLNSQVVDPICMDSETNYPQVSCIQFPANSNLNNIITNLSINTNYDVVLAICVSLNCNLRVIGNVASKTTTPGVADFSGIQTIDPAKNISNLDEVYLNFKLPNFLSGNINGYVLNYYGNSPTNPSPLSVNDLSIPNTTGLNVLTYSVFDDTTITVKGINPLSSDQYCFKLVPFSYNIDGSKRFGDVSSQTPKCITPSIKAPTVLQFTGIDTQTSSCDTLAQSATIKWNIPTIGVFSNFELFYVNDQSSFSFGDAINYSTNSYERILINSTTNSLNLTGLQPGRTYRFGVLTLYNSIDGPIRSEYNYNFFQCTL